MSQGDGIQIVGAEKEELEETSREDLAIIQLTFDTKKHALMLSFDNQKIRSWDFVLGIIEMARVQAEFQRTTRLNQKMNEAQMAQMQEQMLKQQLVAQQSSRRT